MTVPLIGGKFGLQPPHTLSNGGQLEWMVNGDHLCMLNARSVMWMLFRALRISRVWFPSYLCPTVLGAALSPRIEARFYPVEDDLTVNREMLPKLFKAGDLVVLIHYFGFPPDPELTAELMDHGCQVVNDASQALFLDLPSTPGHFFVFSPRKFLGVVDGGILVCRNRRGFDEKRLTAPPEDWLDLALQAASKRAAFDVQGGGDKSWLAMSSAAEDHIPLGPFRMSDASRTTISLVDTTEIRYRRRENYSALLTHLADYAMYRRLPPNVVPLGFPIKVENRDTVRSHLFSREIYPTIHWELGGHVPREFAPSIRLSEEIMTIPCDQRYTLSDMEHIVSACKAAGL